MTGRSRNPRTCCRRTPTLQAEPAHPYVSRGGVKLAGALEQYPDRCRRPCLPRRRRLHRRLHRGAAGERRGHRVRGRCRPRAAAPLAAAACQNRLDGGDRHPQARGHAAAGAARHRHHRRQLHLAEGGAAGGAVACRGTHASAGADQAAIRGAGKARQGRHHPRRRRAQQVCDDIAAFAAAQGCTDIKVFPSAIAGGDGNAEFFLGARRG